MTEDVFRVRRLAALWTAGMGLVLGAVLGCTPAPPDDGPGMDPPDDSVPDPPPEEEPSPPTPGELLEGKWSFTLDDPRTDPTFTKLLITFDRNGGVTEVELRGGIIFRWTGSSIISSTSEVRNDTVSFNTRVSDGVSSEGSIDFSGTFDSATAEEIPGTTTSELRVRGGGVLGVRNEPATITRES